MNEHLLAIVQSALGQAQSESLDEEDTFFMACSACIDYGREIGQIGERVSPEMFAAIQMVVKAVMKELT